MRWWASRSYRSASGAMRHRSAPSRGRRPSADDAKGRQSRGWAGRPSPRQERLYHPWLKTGRGRRPSREVRCVPYRDQIPVLRRIQESQVDSSTSSRTVRPLSLGGQPSHTGQCCEAESPLPTLALSKRLHLLTPAAAYRTTTAVDRWPPAACCVEQHLSSRSFYGGVVQRSWVSKGCAWGAGASSPGLCGRTLA